MTIPRIAANNLLRVVFLFMVAPIFPAVPVVLLMRSLLCLYIFIRTRILANVHVTLVGVVWDYRKGRVP